MNAVDSPPACWWELRIPALVGAERRSALRGNFVQRARVALSQIVELMQKAAAAGLVHRRRGSGGGLSGFVVLLSGQT